jgi:serine/threonine protein kinase
MTETKRLPASGVIPTAQPTNSAMSNSMAGSTVSAPMEATPSHVPMPNEADQLLRGAIDCTKRNIQGTEPRLFSQWRRGRTDVAPLLGKRKVLTGPNGQTREVKRADSAVFEDSVTKSRWIKLPHFAQGSYARVSVMLNVDTQELWAAKSLAYDRKTVRPRPGKPEPMQLANISKEVAAGRAFSRDDYHTVLHVKRAPGDPRSSKIYELTRLEAGTASTAVPAVGTVGKSGMSHRNVYAARLGLDVASTLEFMHSEQSLRAGVAPNPWHSRRAVHVDIKGDNVLVLTDVHPDGTMFRLSDFGMVQAVTDGAPLTGFGGTPGFNAPEMFEFNPVTKAFDKGYGTPFDIWSMGMMLTCVYNAANPFGDDIIGMGTPTHDIEEYKAQVVVTDAHGKQDVDLAEASVLAGPMADFFRPMLDENPTLGKWVILHMLHPDPAQRPTATVLRSFFAAQLQDVSLEDLRTVHRSLFSEASRQERMAQLNKAVGLGGVLSPKEPNSNIAPPATKRVKL